MSRFLYKLIISVIFLLYAGLIYGSQPVSAAYLYFSPSLLTVSQGTVFSVDVWLNTGGQPTVITNVYLPTLNNANIYTVQSITDGKFYPYQNNSVTSTLISIKSLVTDAGQTVSGVGKIASITIQAKSPADLIFIPSCGGTNPSSSVIANDYLGTNILNCSQNQSFTLHITPVTPTPTGSCTVKNTGDADCNGAVDSTDFEILRKEFSHELSTSSADFNRDGIITMVDFEVWRRTHFK